MTDRLVSDDRDTERLEEQDGHSRAIFLRRTALGGGTLLAGGSLLSGVAEAQGKRHRRDDDEHHDRDHHRDDDDDHGSKGNKATDIKILNYALTLEHLEAVFYTQGLQAFSRSDLKGADQLDGAGDRLRNSVYDYFILIRDHEQTHVKTLTAVIKSLGGNPVPPCEYNFAQTAFTSPEKFIAVAQVLENTGVMAYDGAIAYIEAAALQTAGATIATVEARHASYLNLINEVVPFPAAFDTPKAPQEICKLVDSQFIVRCPFDLAAFCASLPNKVIAP